MIGDGMRRAVKEATTSTAGEVESGYFSPAVIVSVSGGRTVCWTEALPAETPTARISRWMTVSNPPEIIEDVVR